MGAEDQAEPSPLGALEDPGDRWLALVRAAEKPRPGGRIGAYEILEEVRHGGEGLVFRARHAGTGRIVALKRLVAGAWSTPAEQRRFEREVELVLDLAHPGIVAVHGVELVDGVPLLAMEWVQGEPLTSWAARLGNGREGTRAKVRLFLQVCEAVQHAHKSGVIHRDLKPTNVLVDHDGRCRLLDFGLARRVPAGDRTETTRTLGFLGTPAYAAPEHFTADEAPIDVRSDVYSLGVMLYECLGGRRPFRAERLHDLIAEIARREPERLSAFADGADRELETIVGKALAKDPAERYQTVHALSEDLQRYLDGRAVQAMPPGALYHVRKWVRRNRLAFGFSLALAVLALAFGVVGSWQAALLAAERTEVGSQKERADAARDEALAALDRAEERGRAAAQALEDLRAAMARVEDEARKTRRVQDFYVDMVYSAAGPTSALHVDTIEELIAQANARARSFFAEDLDVAVEIEAQTARAYVTLYRFDEARTIAQGALRLLDDLPDPPVSLRARLHEVLGEVAFFRGEWIEAHRDALAAVSLYESLPESDSYSGYLITALHALAILEIEASWYADAEQHLRRALQLEERRNGAGYRDVTSSFVADLGAVLFLTGRFAEAEELLLAQLARCEASEGTGPIGPGKVLGALGELYFRWGRPEESVTYLERSLESFREHLPAEHRLIAERQYELGRSLHVAGSCAAAMGALAWILEHDTDQHLKAAALAVQAGCMAGRGQLAASAESYRLAYDAIQPFSSAGDLTRFDVLIEWMDVLVRLERFEEAERLLPRLYEDLRMCATRGDHIAEPHLSQLRAVAALLGQEDGVERKLIETGAKGKEVAAEDPRSGE